MKRFKAAGSLIIGALIVCGLQQARAADRSCWNDGPRAPRPPEITCVALTERFLLSLEGISKQRLVRVMDAPGAVSSDGLHYHFMSNYIGRRGHSGDVNITFEDGRAVLVEAMLDREDDEPKALEFVWNEQKGSCSDFPRSQHRCHETEDVER